MRILGPDGQPISSGPPVSDEVKQIVDRAKELLRNGDPAAALQQMVFAFQSDVNSDLVLDTTCDLLQQMAQVAGAASSEEYQLFDNVRKNREEPIGYYQIGNRFFQLQQFFLARPFLGRAKELLGEAKNELSQVVDVDYSQTLMFLGAYEEAVAAFHKLNDVYGGLPIWLVLAMTECYALQRLADEADEVYKIASTDAASQIEGMEEYREEVGDLLARVRDFDGKEQMGLRDWHYVQTRSILIEENPDENIPGGRFIFYQPSEEDVAYIVGLAAAFLDAREYAPNRIVWVGESAEPLARLFGQWWEIEDENLREYQVGDNADDEENLTLAVMAHSYELPDEETYLDLAPARAGLILFALDLRWTERQALTPDVAGFLSQACNLPWETRLQVGDDQQTLTRIEETRSAPEIAEQIAGQFPKEEECDQWAQELAEEFEGCTDVLLDHRDGSLHRKELVTHSPIRSPRLGF